MKSGLGPSWQVWLQSRLGEANLDKSVTFDESFYNELFWRYGVKLYVSRYATRKVGIPTPKKVGIPTPEKWQFGNKFGWFESRFVSCLAQIPIVGYPTLKKCGKPTFKRVGIPTQVRLARAGLSWQYLNISLLKLARFSIWQKSNGIFDICEL